MTLPESVAFGSLVLGFIGFMYKTTMDEAGKRTRIYTRIDEVKRGLEEKTQSKEICNIHIETIQKDLKEIKEDVKILLKR